MPHDRFYTPLPLSLHKPLTLDGEEAAHLKVMRIKEGETIQLINGKGKLATARLIEIKRREAELKVEKIEEREKSNLCLILAQALPRLNRLEVILEKGTELGVDTFWLFPGEQSEKGHLTDTQLKRLERITISAMKQCGRLYLPEIILMPPPQEVV